MKSTNKPSTRRLWEIDQQLRSGKYPTVPQLAQLFETNDKTVRRDLDYLRYDLHAPAEYCPINNGWHYTEPTYRLPALLITQGELLAIFLTGQTIPHVQGTPYEADLRQAITKLAEFLPEEISFHIDQIQQAHSFRQTATTTQDLDIFRRLADAVLQRKQLTIRYWTASREAESQRTIDPWHLASVNGEWYLIAYCHTRKDRRMFAPNRIRDLQDTGGTYEIPDNFSIADFFDGTFRVINDSTQPLQTVQVRFLPSAAKYIREKIWHPSQVAHPQPDGSYLVELSLRSLIEVKRWILSWGAECEVLAPAELRADIRNEALKILEQSATATTIDRIPSRTERSRQQRRKSL